MKRCRNENGSVMMEVMMLITAILVIIASIMTLATSEYRLVMRRLQQERAGYAAVSSLRLMAEAILSDEGELLLNEGGLDKTVGTISFESEKGQAFVPVTVWTEREKEELVLYAKAESGGVSETISLIMEYDGCWYPVQYDFFQEE